MKFYAGKLLVIILIVSCNILPSCDKKEDDTDSPVTNQTKLNRTLLQEALEMGVEYIKNCQKEEGNFVYEYDWTTQYNNPDDNEVRQAGALWGLSLIFNHTKDTALLPYLQKGFTFFENNASEDGTKKWTVYPGKSSGKTGTVALLTLAHIEVLRTDATLEASFKSELETSLAKYIQFLVALKKDNGLFYGSYSFETGDGYGSSSPYADGESLLALTKAAKYLNYTDLVSTILDSAKANYTVNVVEALDIDPDSDTTKGFYQWGSMLFYEIATSDWNQNLNYSSIVIDLAVWMIDVHKTLSKPRNTAYAYEGIIHAYELARLDNATVYKNKFASVIDEGLYKLSTWQVGSSIQNEFLQNNPTSDPLAVGGIMNEKDDPLLRIDVTQHQMHAVILAMRYVYK